MILISVGLDLSLVLAVSSQQEVQAGVYSQGAQPYIDKGPLLLRIQVQPVPAAEAELTSRVEAIWPVQVHACSHIAISIKNVAAPETGILWGELPAWSRLPLQLGGRSGCPSTCDCGCRGNAQGMAVA